MPCSMKVESLAAFVVIGWLPQPLFPREQAHSPALCCLTSCTWAAMTMHRGLTH